MVQKNTTVIVIILLLASFCAFSISSQNVSANAFTDWFRSVFGITGNVTAGEEFIIDDGDAAWNAVGSWSPTGEGYNGDMHFSSAGSGESYTTWSPSLTSGKYKVYISWAAHPNRATNTPYTLYYSEGSYSFTVNQELLADQLTSAVAWSDWYYLGTFNLDESSYIEMNNNADEFVISDAVKFVYEGEQSPYVCGNNIKEEYEVCDGSDLSGKTCESQKGSGWTGILACSSDCSSFDVSGCIPPSEIIIDDGGLGYSSVPPIGSWGSLGGYDGDSHYSGGGSGDNYAIWSPNLPSGFYEVYISWWSQFNLATNTPYTLYTIEGEYVWEHSFTVNQQLLADQLTPGNGWSDWYYVGTFSLDESSYLKMTNNANSFVVADAAKFVMVTPETEICNDNIDNDLDTLIDCDDIDCQGDVNCFHETMIQVVDQAGFGRFKEDYVKTRQADPLIIADSAAEFDAANALNNYIVSNYPGAWTAVVSDEEYDESWSLEGAALYCCSRFSTCKKHAQWVEASCGDLVLYTCPEEDCSAKGSVKQANVISHELSYANPLAEGLIYGESKSDWTAEQWDTTLVPGVGVVEYVEYPFATDSDPTYGGSFLLVAGGDPQSLYATMDWVMSQLPEICNDGVDNNGDTLVDCDDPQCATDPACVAGEELICDDNIDNDGDTLVDCDDNDCIGDVNCFHETMIQVVDQAAFDQFINIDFRRDYDNGLFTVFDIIPEMAASDELGFYIATNYPNSITGGIDDSDWSWPLSRTGGQIGSCVRCPKNPETGEKPQPVYDCSGLGEGVCTAYGCCWATISSNTAVAVTWPSAGANPIATELINAGKSHWTPAQWDAALSVEGVGVMDYLIVSDPSDPYYGNHLIVAANDAQSLYATINALKNQLPEVCDDGIDNNGDTLVDCADPQCATDPACGLPCDNMVATISAPIEVDQNSFFTVTSSVTCNNPTGCGDVTATLDPMPLGYDLSENYIYLSNGKLVMAKDKSVMYNVFGNKIILKNMLNNVKEWDLDNIISSIAIDVAGNIHANDAIGNEVYLFEKNNPYSRTDVVYDLNNVAYGIKIESTYGGITGNAISMTGHAINWGMTGMAISSPGYADKILVLNEMDGFADIYSLSTGELTDLNIAFPTEEFQYADYYGISEDYVFLTWFEGADWLRHISYYNLATDTLTDIPMIEGAEWMDISWNVFNNKGAVVQYYDAVGLIGIYYYDIASGMLTRIDPNALDGFALDTPTGFDNYISIMYIDEFGEMRIGYYDLSAGQLKNFALPEGMQDFADIMFSSEDYAYLRLYDTDWNFADAGYYEFATDTFVSLMPPGMNDVWSPVGVPDNYFGLIINDENWDVKSMYYNKATGQFSEMILPEGAMFGDIAFFNDKYAAVLVFDTNWDALDYGYYEFATDTFTSIPVNPHWWPSSYGMIGNNIEMGYFDEDLGMSVISLYDIDAGTLNVIAENSYVPNYRWIEYMVGEAVGKGIISTTVGATPFYTTSSNPQVCSSMGYGDICVLSWQVNATGDAGTYDFFVTYDVNNGLCTLNSPTTPVTIIGAPVCTDVDGDGYAIEGGACGEIDCNDANANVYPGAAEICTDGLDNDCDGLIDCADSNCATDPACIVIICGEQASSPYFIQSELDAQGITLVSETFNETHWMPVLSPNYGSMNLTICNVHPSGWPMFVADDVIFKNNLEKCSPGDDYPSAQINISGQFDGIEFVNCLDFKQIDLDLEHTPVSYQTGTYELLWQSDPYYDGDDLYLMKGSGNVVSTKIEFSQLSDDLNEPVVVGLDGELTGVFSLETFTQALRCPIPSVCTTGRYNYFKCNIKGVGAYNPLQIQFEDSSYDSTSFTDTYDMCEHNQLVSEARSSDGKVESNCNSNFIGGFTGMAPLFPKINYTFEAEYEYMPVSYQTGTYDQKWRIYPSYHDNRLDLGNGTGNVITERIELEGKEIGKPVGIGSSIGVFSIQAFVKGWPDYGYAKSSVKGVGFRKAAIEFASSEDYNELHLMEFSNAESFSQTNQAYGLATKYPDPANPSSLLDCPGGTSCKLNATWNTQIIGVLEGAKAIGDLTGDVTLTASSNFEYMPVSYQTGSLDKKWESHPYFDGSKLYLYNGSGNMVTNNVEFEQTGAEAKKPVGIGNMTGVLSVQASIMGWPSYGYEKSAVKGVVAAENFGIEFAGVGNENKMHLMDLNSAEMYQGYNEYRLYTSYMGGPDYGSSIDCPDGTSCRFEADWNLNTIGSVLGAAPLNNIYGNARIITNNEFEYMPVSYQTGSYDQKWGSCIEETDNSMKLFCGTGYTIMDVVEIDSPLIPAGVGGFIGTFSIKDNITKESGHGYEMANVKGVGKAEQTFYFETSEEHGKTFLPEFSSVEMIQGTTGGSDSSSNVDINIIGVYDGVKALQNFNLGNWTHEMELEYAPFTACDGMTYDQKWGSCFEETANSFKYFCGTGNIYLLKGDYSSDQNVMAIGGTTVSGNTLVVDLTHNSTHWKIGPTMAVLIGTEFFYTLNEACTDADGDGICGSIDNCCDDYNPDQADSDFDCTGDVCECVDADGDGYAGTPYGCGDDCNDNNAAIHPNADDSNCNGVDENCNGVADEDYIATLTECGVDLCYNTGQMLCVNGQTQNTCVPAPPVIVFRDADGDGYGNELDVQEVCTLPAGYIFFDDDCNDNDASVNPGAQDICDVNGNVINRDCNPDNDGELNCHEFCGDIDGDGYVTDEKWGEWGGIIPSIICPWIKDTGDCNDADAAINPEALEICDGIDNNCNGIIDDSYEDSDNDGVYECQDRCQGTAIDNMNMILNPKNYGDIDGDGVFEWNAGSNKAPNIIDSSVTLASTYGCSCTQILSCKPGNNAGELKYGCTGGPNGLGTQGTINLWITQSGWAAYGGLCRT